METVKLNKEPIEYKGKKLDFFKIRYYKGNTAISVLTEKGEYYDYLTTNLSFYGIDLPDNMIAFHHENDKELEFLFKKLFVKRRVGVVQGKVEQWEVYELKGDEEND